MAKIFKLIFKVVMQLLQITCMLFLMVSVVCSVVSLNPDVKWNEYVDEDYLQDYYYNTIWSSVDAYQYVGGAGACNNGGGDGDGDGEEDAPENDVDDDLILKEQRDETWKVPIRSSLNTSLGLSTTSLCLLIVSMVIQTVKQEKLFVVVPYVSSALFSSIGGYHSMQAISEYKASLVKGITDTYVKNNYYMPEHDNFRYGYLMARNGGILAITGCCLVLVLCGLYIPFGEGRWMWQKKTNITPDESSQEI